MRFNAASGEAAPSLDLVMGIVLVAVSLLTFSVGLLQWFLRRIWTVLLTDRRILKRQGQQHEEIRLTDIEEINPYLPEDGLFVTGGGRKLAITCRPKKAERLHAAIEAARQGAAR